MNDHVLEPAAQQIADATSQPPFLYDLGPDGARKVLDDIGDQDLNIPVAVHRFLAERAGSKGTREVAGGSHAAMVSEPDAVAATILDALATM